MPRPRPPRPPPGPGTEGRERRARGRPLARNSTSLLAPAAAGRSDRRNRTTLVVRVRDRLGDFLAHGLIEADVRLVLEIHRQVALLVHGAGDLGDLARLDVE